MAMNTAKSLPVAKPQPRMETAEAVFGPAGRNVNDLNTWARQSTRLFVRSQVQIAHHSEGAKGRVLSAFEALKAFGWPVLEQLADKDSAVIVSKGHDAATVLRTRRGDAGLSQQQIANSAGVPLEDLQAAEEGRKRSPIRVLTKVAKALALDPDRIGTAMDGGGDKRLGVRLRDVHQGPGAMSVSVVLGLAEAAWVIAAQSRLEEWLDSSRTNVWRSLGFTPQPMPYAYPPPFAEGMDLAHRTRDLLRISQDAPILSLKALLEDRLSIPVVQLSLPARFAGATIANGGNRGVAVNVDGINSNVWVRRMTVAHELGHLLWDPDEDLNRLRVDDQDTLTGDWNQVTDKFEKRANAFAAELLAPQAAVAEVYESAGEGPEGVSAVMQRFGIERTAATWQIYNARDGRGQKPLMRAVPGTVAADEWNADEASTADYFTFAATPISRRGRFAELCLLAYESNLISGDTAADYLGIEPGAFDEGLPALKSLFAR